MSTVETNPHEPEQVASEEMVYGVATARLDAARNEPDIKTAVEIIYPGEEVQKASRALIEDTDFINKANGRRWAVLVLAGNDPRAIVAKRVEMEKFCTYFGTNPTTHHMDYAKYDDSSIFVVNIDVQDLKDPKPASALRIIHNGEEGLKTINTLTSADKDENPWEPEIDQLLGGFEYNAIRASKVIVNAFGVEPGTTWAIESMAALDQYSGKRGSLGEATFPLYAACLQMSNRASVKSWISIQDLNPMIQMQELFNDPWEWLALPPKAYDGPNPTIPASIPDLQDAQRLLMAKNPEMGEILINGKGLELTYVMPEELQGQEYLDSIAANTKVQS